MLRIRLVFRSLDTYRAKNTLKYQAWKAKNRARRLSKLRSVCSQRLTTGRKRAYILVTLTKPRDIKGVVTLYAGKLFSCAAALPTREEFEYSFTDQERCQELQCTHQVVGQPPDDVGLIHPPAVVGKRRPDVHGRFLVPVWQKVVEAIVGQRLHWRTHAVPRGIQGLGRPWFATSTHWEWGKIDADMRRCHVLTHRARQVSPRQSLCHPALPLPM